MSAAGRREGVRGGARVLEALQALPSLAGGSVGEAGRDGGLFRAGNWCTGLCCAGFVGDVCAVWCMGLCCGDFARALRCRAGRRRATALGGALRGVWGRGHCRCLRRAVGAGGGGGVGGAANWCMRLCCADVARGACADWCMGSCCAGGGAGGEVGRAGDGDRLLPGREGSGDRVAAHAVRGGGDAAGRLGRRPQLGRVAIQSGDEGGRQMGQVVHDGREDAVAAQQGKPVVVFGAGRGAGVAVDGVGGAHPVATPGLRRGRLSGVRGPGLRPPCMRQRSLPWIAGERQGQPERVRAPRGSSPRAGCAWTRWRVGLPRGFFVGGAAAVACEGCGMGALLVNVRCVEGIVS